MVKFKNVIFVALLVGTVILLNQKKYRNKVQKFITVIKEKNVGNKGGIETVIKKEKSKILGQINDGINFKDEDGLEYPEYAEETFQEVAKTAGNVAETVIEGNQMLDEGGGQTVIDEYNKMQDSQEIK